MIHDYRGITGYIDGDDTTSTNFDIVADGYTTNNIDACSNHDIITDNRSTTFAFTDCDTMIDRTVFADSCIMRNHDTV